MEGKFSRPLTDLASTIADGIDRGMSPNAIAMWAVERGWCSVPVEDDCVVVHDVGTVTSKADGNVEIDFFGATVCLSHRDAAKLAEVVEEAAESAFDKADFSQRIKESE